MENKKNADWPERLLNFAINLKDGFAFVGNEIWLGFKHRTIPIFRFGIATFIIALAIGLRFDLALFNLCHIGRFYPRSLVGFWIYVGIFLTLPEILWLFERRREKRRILKHLTTHFREANLVTNLGRMPNVISDRSVDDSVRETRIALNGVTFSAFVSAKENLRQCFGYVEDIIDEENGQILVRYSHAPLPQNTKITAIPEVHGPYTFAVGYSRVGLVTANLSQVPHIMVAGSTNSGKSTFLRQFIATIVAKNKGVSIHFIDLKHNLEAKAFESVPGVVVQSTPEAAISVLEQAHQEMADRGRFLAQNNLTTIEELEKTRKPVTWTPAYPNLKTLGRRIIIIDEAAELFLAGPRFDTKDVQLAKRLASTIAATGRAVGVHLVVATQRPDKNAIDTKIKANLAGRLCFHMPDNVSSVTAIDSGRAAQIPNQPGRAIWKEGNSFTEVRTLLLEKSDLASIFREPSNEPHAAVTKDPFDNDVKETL